MFYSCFETPYSVIRTQVHLPLTHKGRLYEIIHRNLLAWEILKRNIYCTVQYNTSNLPF